MKEWPFPSWMHTPVAPVVWQMHKTHTQNCVHKHFSLPQLHNAILNLMHIIPQFGISVIHHYSPLYLPESFWKPTIIPYEKYDLEQFTLYYARRWNRKNLPRLQKYIEVHKWVQNWSNVLEWNDLWYLSLHLISIPFSNVVSFTEVCKDLCLLHTLSPSDALVTYTPLNVPQDLYHNPSCMWIFSGKRLSENLYLSV